MTTALAHHGPFQSDVLMNQHFLLPRDPRSVHMDQEKTISTKHDFSNLHVEIPKKQIFNWEHESSPSMSTFLPSAPSHLIKLDPSNASANIGAFGTLNMGLPGQSLTFDNKRSPIGTPSKSPGPGSNGETFEMGQMNANTWQGQGRKPPLSPSQEPAPLLQDAQMMRGLFDPIGTPKSSPSGSEDWWGESGAANMSGSNMSGSSPSRVSSFQRPLNQRGNNGNWEGAEFGRGDMKMMNTGNMPLDMNMRSRNNMRSPTLNTEMSLSAYALGGGFSEDFDNVGGGMQGRQMARGQQQRTQMHSQVPRSELRELDDVFGGLELNEVAPQQQQQQPQHQQPVYSNQPSRTLSLTFSASFDEQALVSTASAFGAVQMLIPSGKGCYTLSYFDIRSALAAANRFHNATLGGAHICVRFLDDGNWKQGILAVHGIPESVRNVEILALFRSFGEVQDVRGAGGLHLVWFYDIRHAHSALSLNGSEIVGNLIRVIPASLAGMQFRPVKNTPSSPPPAGVGAMSFQGGDMSHQMENARASRQLNFPLKATNHSMSPPAAGPDHVDMSPLAPKHPDPFLHMEPFPQQSNHPYMMGHQDGFSDHYAQSQEQFSKQVALLCESYQKQQEPYIESFKQHTQSSDSYSDPYMRSDSYSEVYQMGGSPVSQQNQQQARWGANGRGEDPLSLSPLSLSPLSLSPQQHACSPGGQSRDFRMHGVAGGMATHGRQQKGGNGFNKNGMFVLDVERVRKGDDKRTTLMIRNIPNKYSQKMLLQTVDERHKGLYDFLYLPIDFKNKCNVGYAFINFINPLTIASFYQTFNRRKWEKFNSDKVCELAYARIQGKYALISHFQNSSLMTEDKKCRPLIFFSDGPNQGTYEAFPVGPNVRRRTDGAKHDEKPQ